MKFDRKSLLGKMGPHDWSRPRTVYISGSNVRDVEKYCKRCGKQKRWIEIVK